MEGFIGGSVDTPALGLRAVHLVRIKDLCTVTYERAIIYAAIEARAMARMARCIADLFHLKEQYIAIAVDANLADMLHIAARFALTPHSLARPTPVHHASGVERFLQSCSIHIRHHEYVAGGMVLHNCCYKTIIIELNVRKQVGSHR